MLFLCYVIFYIVWIKLYIKKENNNYYDKNITVSINITILISFSIIDDEDFDDNITLIIIYIELNNLKFYSTETKTVQNC